MAHFVRAWFRLQDLDFKTWEVSQEQSSVFDRGKARSDGAVHDA